MKFIIINVTNFSQYRSENLHFKNTLHASVTLTCLVRASTPKMGVMINTNFMRLSGYFALARRKVVRVGAAIFKQRGDILH